MESVAAQVIVSLIPIVGIGCAAILAFFAFLWRHLENKTRIEKGTYSPKNFNMEAFSFLLGLCLTGIGIVLSVLFILLDGVSLTAIAGLIPLSLGVALLIFYKCYPRQDKKDVDQNKDNEN